MSSIGIVASGSPPRDDRRHRQLPLAKFYTVAPIGDIQARARLRASRLARRQGAPASVVTPYPWHAAPSWVAKYQGMDAFRNHIPPTQFAVAALPGIAQYEKTGRDVESASEHARQQSGCRRFESRGRGRSVDPSLASTTRFADPPSRRAGSEAACPWAASSRSDRTFVTSSGRRIRSRNDDCGRLPALDLCLTAAWLLRPRSRSGLGETSRRRIAQERQPVRCACGALPHSSRGHRDLLRASSFGFAVDSYRQVLL